MALHILVGNHSVVGWQLVLIYVRIHPTHYNYKLVGEHYNTM
jgi:hypothetical protein